MNASPEGQVVEEEVKVPANFEEDEFLRLLAGFIAARLESIL